MPFCNHIIYGNTYVKSHREKRYTAETNFCTPNSGKGSLLGFWLLQEKEKVQMQREINLNIHTYLQVCCSRFGWVAPLCWEVLCNR